MCPKNLNSTCISVEFTATTVLASKFLVVMENNDKTPQEVTFLDIRYTDMQRSIIITRYYRAALCTDSYCHVIKYVALLHTRSKSQTPLHGHRLRTPPTDKICHIPTSWHVEMLGSGIAMWQICCRIVVRSPLVVFVAGVRSRCPCSGVWL